MGNLIFLIHLILILMINSQSHSEALCKSNGILQGLITIDLWLEACSHLISFKS